MAAMIFCPFGFVAYWMYGWENVVDELACTGIIAAVYMFGITRKSDGYEIIFIFMWGCLATLAAAVVCAFCEPGSTTEIVLIAVLAAPGLVLSVQPK